MATIIPNFLTSKVVSNLDTYNYTVQTAAMHVATIQLNELPPSGVSITIEQNGSPVAASAAPAATQGAISLSATMNCAVSDVISFVISSSTPSDEGLNCIKATLNVHIGSLN
jgi:hypothetical protein